MGMRRGGGGPMTPGVVLCHVDISSAKSRSALAGRYEYVLDQIKSYLFTLPRALLATFTLLTASDSEHAP